MYATDHNMVIHSCAKHSMTLSRDKKSRHRPCKLTLRSKVNVESGSWMYATHPLMVIDPCAKYGKSMSHQKIVKDRTQKQVKNPINLTLWSKSTSYRDHECTGKQHILSWWYTHVPNMVSQCQTKKKLLAGHKSAQMDRQSDSYLPPWTSFMGVSKLLLSTIIII